MTMRGRLVAVLGLFIVAAALVVWAVATLITPGTPGAPGVKGGVVDFTHTQAAGQPVNLTVQTVGAIGFGSHPTWVSYLTKDPTTGKWIHDNTWQLPTNTVIHMTVLQYDSGSPLRNQQFGQVTGTIGGTASLNGTSYSVYNSYTGNGVGHTFVVPSLGISVPLIGAGGNICAAGPCHVSNPHNTITFSFKTPKHSGEYHWQCFVPCGVGYLYGNGGGMSTQNFMGGFLDVVA